MSKEEQVPEYSKEELYEKAKEMNLFVCGDPDSIDEEKGVDYSHLTYLVETGQIMDKYETIGDVWPVLWRTIENFMQKLVMSGEDARDLQNENKEWRDSYGEIATELRVARKYINKTPFDKKEFIKFRMKELKKLEKHMAKAIETYEQEKKNEKTLEEN